VQYKLIHHLQYEQNEEERKVLELAIDLANEGYQPDYLARVAHFLAEHTGACYILIGLLQEDKQHIQSCVFLKNKAALPDIVYALKGTPCEAVTSQGFCYYPFNVTRLFPGDADLQLLQIESYLGTMLFSGQEDPIGLIAIMDTRPIENAAFLEHLILVLSLSIEQALEKLVPPAIENPA
jgi:hypothetical protein